MVNTNSRARRRVPKGEYDMTKHDLPDRLHPSAELYAGEYRAGLLSRREFLTRASALGVSATAA